MAGPLASWLESFFGLDRDVRTGQLVRRTPQPVGGPQGAAGELAKLTGLDEDACKVTVESYLLMGSKLRNPTNGLPVASNAGDLTPLDVLSVSGGFYGCCSWTQNLKMCLGREFEPARA